MGGENNVLKKLREKSKSKKGFTLVELIVVIVIILILAAVMVPSLMRYIDRAQEANCRADAATIMSQLQADYAASQATEHTGVDIDWTTGETIGNVTVVLDGTASATVAAFTVDADNQIDSFTYMDAHYTAAWTLAAGWTLTPVP